MDLNHKKLEAVEQKLENLEQRKSVLKKKQRREGLSSDEEVDLEELVEKIMKLEKKEREWMKIIEGTTINMYNRTFQSSPEQVEGLAEQLGQLGLSPEDKREKQIIENINGDSLVVYLGAETYPVNITNEGISLKSANVVKRQETVDEIISNLKQSGVLLIKSPPMTGKTSLATLVADYLCQCKDDEKKLVINLSMLNFGSKSYSWDFEKLFYR
ncbi:hypothetical protein HDV01_001861, partial [Terramyces sp. JEL0728]